MLVLGIYFGINVGFVLGAFWRSLFIHRREDRE